MTRHIFLMHKTEGTACIPTIVYASYIYLLEGFWGSDAYKILKTLMCRSKLTRKTFSGQNAFSQFVFWPNCVFLADAFSF
jgi:hypothetical protein